MQLRKLASTAVGALLAGSSIAMPALGATLDDLPAPFVADGQADFVVVVGADAATADVVGAIDIVARLGGETVVTEEDEDVSATGDAWRVEETGDDLNYDEAFGGVDGTVDETELDTLLADGTFDDNEGNTDNDVSYTQRITFASNEGGTLVFEADTESDDEVLDTYLKLTDGRKAYTYELKFDDGVEFDNASTSAVKDDFEGAKLEILGKMFTVSDAVASPLTGDAITKIVLLGGAVEGHLEDGEAGTATLDGVEYEITPDILDDDEVRFTVVYEGTTETTDGMDEGDTFELENGVEIGIDDIFFSEKESKVSSVDFRLGARKVTMEDGKAVELNDEDLDGSLVDLVSSAGELTEINVSFAPEDDVFLKAGDTFEDAIFGAFKIDFDSLADNNWEDLKMTTTSSEGRLEAVNSNDETIKIDVQEVGTDVYWGDDTAPGGTQVDGNDYNATGATGNLLFTNGDECYDIDSTALADLEAACQDILLLVVGSGGEARIIEITDIDTTNDEIDFRDKTTDKSFDDKDYTVNANTNIDLGFATITLNVSEGARNFDGPFELGTEVGITFDTLNQFSNKRFKTSLQGEVLLDLINATAPGAGTLMTTGDDVVNVSVFDEDEGDRLFRWNVSRDSDGDVTLTSVSGHADGLVQVSEENDEQQAVLDGGNITGEGDASGTPWGATLWYDSENKDDLTIKYPEEQVSAVVFLSEIESQVIGGVSGRRGQITTSVSKLDTEVTAPASEGNIILVGGPCANRLVARLNDDGKYPWACADLETLPTGAGYSIELINDAFATGQVAMVVAGVSADDTRDAASRVQNFDTDGLTGASVRTGVLATA